VQHLVSYWARRCKASQQQPPHNRKQDYRQQHESKSKKKQPVGQSTGTAVEILQRLFTGSAQVACSCEALIVQGFQHFLDFRADAGDGSLPLPRYIRGQGDSLLLQRIEGLLALLTQEGL